MFVVTLCTCPSVLTLIIPKTTGADVAAFSEGLSRGIAYKPANWSSKGLFTVLSLSALEANF